MKSIEAEKSCISKENLVLLFCRSFFFFFFAVQHINHPWAQFSIKWYHSVLDKEISGQKYC